MAFKVGDLIPDPEHVEAAKLSVPATSTPDNPKGAEGRPAEPPPQASDYTPASEGATPPSAAPARSYKVGDVIDENSLPVDQKHGIIQRPGEAPVPQPPVNFTYDEQTAKQAESFDYSKSPLHHIMSENTARALVQAHLKQEGIKTTLGDNINRAALFFLNDNVKDHMSTMLDSMGSNKSWDQLASEYGQLRKSRDTANPVTAQVGKLAGGATAAVAGGAGLTGAAGKAAQAMGGAANAIPPTIYPAIGRAVAATGAFMKPIMDEAMTMAKWSLRYAVARKTWHAIEGE